MAQAGFTSVEQVRAALAEQNYLSEEGLTTAVYLALTLKRPLLLEGEAGVGKTELAKVIAAMTGGELIRLQCYEGIDAAQAVYDWDYSRQLLHLRAAEASGEATSKKLMNWKASYTTSAFSLSAHSFAPLINATHLLCC